MIVLMNRDSCMTSETMLEKAMQFLPVGGEREHTSLDPWVILQEVRLSEGAVMARPLDGATQRESCPPSDSYHMRNLKPELPSQAIPKVLLKKPWEIANDSCHFKPLSFRVRSYMAIANQNTLPIRLLEVTCSLECSLSPPKRGPTRGRMETLTRGLPFSKWNGL